MGALAAIEIAEALPLRQALTWHLGSNHFPPVHPVFVDTAIEALDLANDDDWDEMLELPNGISLSVGAVIEQLHLDAFLDDERLWA